MKNETMKYSLLNDLAEQGGVVILGGGEDAGIPLCELKQAFALNSKLYNRSVSGLSVQNAKDVYGKYAAALAPESVLLHLGADDLELFEEDPARFDQLYRELIQYIRAQDSRCNIAVVSLKNPQDSAVIADLNRHLQYIAESEQCEYGDIAARRVWNPRDTQEVVSFVYSLGFVRPLKNRHPLNDLIRILFCYEDGCGEAVEL